MSFYIDLILSHKELKLLRGYFSRHVSVLRELKATLLVFLSLNFFLNFELPILYRLVPN